MQGKLQQLLFHVADPGVVTDLKGEVVEGKTLLAGDGAPLCVVGPRREHEQQALGTSIKILPGWFVKRKEAVFQDDDERMLSIQCSCGASWSGHCRSAIQRLLCSEAACPSWLNDC